MTEAPKPSPLGTPDPWTLVADDYTRELLPMFELFAKDALALVKPPAGARLLDVAAGPGTVTLLAAAQGFSVAAIDFAPQMVANLRRRLDEARLQADVRLGDGQALPWGDAQFAAAFSMFGLMFFPDRTRGLAELWRVLEPGGCAVVSSWAPFEGIFKSLIGAVGEALSDSSFGKASGPLGDPDGFAADLRAAGFADVQISTRRHAAQVDSPAALWEQWQRTNARIVLLKRQLGEARWAEVARDVRTRLEAQHGTGPVEISTTAYLGFGKKP